MFRDEVQAVTAGNFSIVQKDISLFALAEANVHTHDGLGQDGVRDRGLHFACEAPSPTVYPSSSKEGNVSEVLTGSSPL